MEAKSMQKRENNRVTNTAKVSKATAYPIGVPAVSSRELGSAQTQALEVLRQYDEWLSPTNVATLMGSKWGSAHTTPILQSLVKRGLVERNARGHYKAFPEIVVDPAQTADHAECYLRATFRVFEVLREARGERPSPWAYMIDKVCQLIMREIVEPCDFEPHGKMALGQ